ncbi:response regulator [Paenibacillus puerhi]|uniref:response regulator n=1 Tax=Paenibacillus puerhi TaxID=2692622 RepID=UPI00135745AA|nr:response regulator [Paenibacillus puerhi]
MKRVMLVDDEVIIREVILDCIDWEKEGFLYCGDAPDGEMALPMIEELRPDILITDIMMPFMNGLELSSIVRSRYPDIKIIILSGHEDFEYARTAMRIGVSDYCLKPIRAHDLIELLRKASDSIDKERELKMTLDKLKQSQLDQLKTSREQLLNDLCSGFVTTAEAIHLSSTLALDLQARYYVAVIADVRYPDSHSPSDAKGGNVDAENDLLRKFQELAERPGMLKFKRSRTETAWMIKGDTLEQLKEELDAFKELQTITAEHDFHSSVSVSIGIGSVQDRLQGVHLSFLEAAEDMYWRRLSRQNMLTLWESSSVSREQYVFLDRSKFVDFLKIGSPSQLHSFVDDYISELKEINWTSSPIGYYILNDLTLEVFRSAKDMYRHREAPEQALHQLQQILRTVRTLQEATDYLIRLTNQFWTWRNQTNDKYGDMLMKVQEYILSSYDKDTISLQDAADFVKVSPSHLSKVFSQEMNRTFVEYLTHVRIRKAMELLKTTSAKSYEIAYSVGYNDAHYFSNLFKRITGMTTREFKKNGNMDTIISSLDGGGKAAES